jgi:ribokinase
MRANIAVIGSLVVDMAMRTPRVPRRGDNMHAQHFQMDAGGKGANAATAIVRLGGRAVLTGCVGDDLLGRYELEILTAEGVDTGGVIPVQNAPTAVAFILVDDGGENTVLVANRTNEQLTAAMVEQALDPHWEQLDGLLVNFEAAEEAVAFAVKAGRRHGLPVVVDPAPALGYKPESWRDATAMVPNTYEVGKLLGREFPNDDPAAFRQAACDLLDLGPQMVALKLGGQGALLVTHEGEWSLPAHSVDVKDTTGAGDAFSAGLTLALAEGRSPEEALHFANAAGAVAVTRLGTLSAMPTRAEVKAHLNR